MICGMNRLWLKCFATLSFGFILAGCATDGVAPQLAVSREQALQPFNPGDDQTIWDISRVDMVPQPRRQSAPKPPAELLRKGARAQALIDFVVDENGMTRRVFAIQATNVAFGQTAVEAVAKWKFSPGRKDGKPVRTHLQIPMSFSTDEN